MGELKIYQALILLALCEEKGTMNASYVGYAVASALLTELLMLEKIQVDPTEKKPKKAKVEVIDSFPTGDAILDEALDKIHNAKRQAALRDWVSKLAGIKDLNHKVAKTLAADNILKAEEEQILWLFTRRIYPEINPEPEQRLRHELRRLVLDKPLEIDPRIVVTLSLARAAHLLPQVFSKAELKANKEKIDAIANGEGIGKITKEVIEGIQVALMMAAIMPAITVTTT